MPGGQFLELLLLKWSDFDNSKIAAGHFTHNYGLDHLLEKTSFRCYNLLKSYRITVRRLLRRCCCVLKASFS